jgi:ABC-type lipoprotein export system ATPase subunit
MYMSTNYAKFWKCALQVNPWTYAKQYQGSSHGLSEKDYNDALVDRCLKAEIQVVGIADHGCVDGIQNLRDAFESAGIVVFPGFEIASTEKVHMVCLYPSGTSVGALNQFLGNLEVPAGTKKTTPSSLGCIAIAERVSKQGGFWYAAHVTGANGLLRLNQDGGGLAHIWISCDHVFAAQIAGDIDSIPELEVQKILRNKNPQYNRVRPIALLNSKDVRRPEDLDNPRVYSWIKMTSPTLEALQLACRDPESRSRLSDQVNPTYYSRIERIVVKRGYLEDLDLELSPNLNAIVGGRGTGKSTLIEAIRYALQLTPANKDALRAHNSIIDANFGKEKAGIEITLSSFQQNSERYIVSRYHGEPAKVLDESGKVLKLSPKDVLPEVEVYGQNELLAIVQDDAAKASLLGRFLPDDSAVREQVASLEASLQKNRLELDGLDTKIADIATKLDQLPALLDKEKSFKKLGLEKQLEQVKTRETQRAYVSDASDAVASLAATVEEFEGAIEDLETPELPTDCPTSALKGFKDAVTLAKSGVMKAAAQARQAIEEAQAALQASKAIFDQALSGEEHEFNTTVNKLPALKGKSVAQLTSEYRKVSADIAKLKPLGGQKTGHETKLLSLNQDRANSLEKLAKARNSRWTALGKAVKTLNKRLEGQLRVEFEPGRVRTPLKEFLLSCRLEGVGDKRLAWIDEAENLSVADLVGLIREGNDALLNRFRKAGMQKQVADCLAALPTAILRALEELSLPERMELLLNVTRDGDNYREVGKLSTGQQCTAILHLLLLDNHDPLIIDQPEDNLDNAFIADHIVNELRASKTKRQFVFATHNANIPVFGDAEWIGVLQEEEGRSRLRASGSIDAADVKEFAANILEGGREAFTHRREKYGL